MGQRGGQGGRGRGHSEGRKLTALRLGLHWMAQGAMDRANGVQSARGGATKVAEPALTWRCVGGVPWRSIQGCGEASRQGMQAAAACNHTLPCRRYSWPPPLPLAAASASMPPPSAAFNVPSCLAAAARFHQDSRVP